MCSVVHFLPLLCRFASDATTAFRLVSLEGIWVVNVVPDFGCPRNFGLYGDFKFRRSLRSGHWVRESFSWFAIEAHSRRIANFGGLEWTGPRYLSSSYINVQFVHHCVFPLLEDFEVAARGLVFQCSLGEVEGSVVKVFPQRPTVQNRPDRRSGAWKRKLEHVVGCAHGSSSDSRDGLLAWNAPDAKPGLPEDLSDAVCVRKSRFTRPRVCLGFLPAASSVAPSGVACQASPAVHFSDKFDSLQQEHWQTSRHLVEELGFSSDDANDILSLSFGWSYSDYWGEEKEATVPDPESESASLSLMKSLGLDMAALAKKLSEVIA